MAKAIKAKLVLEKRAQGLSMNQIASQFHVSKHSVCRVLERADAKSIKLADVAGKTDTEVYSLLFPEKQSANTVHSKPDYGEVTRELTKVGVTLKLLHAEYMDECRRSGAIACGYSKFCADYEAFRIQNGYTNRIIHKPGLRVEVDWSGPTMHYSDRVSGQDITVYLFVSTLPYSQYSYVEPCMDMKQPAWLQCHVSMWDYFGGVTSRIVCDNLRTGVTNHPKEGEIILNDEYLNLAEHYSCAIMPAGIKKPKHKASVEGSVGDVATAIIAKLRNRKFLSFESLKAAVAEKLEEFNGAEFDKREGSRHDVFRVEEQPTLHALPAVPYEPSVWYCNRTVQLNSHVAFEKNYYSCPWRYLNKHVDLKVSSTRVEIYHDGARIQMHRRIPSSIRNRYATVESDMPLDKQYQEWSEQRIRTWASDIGKATETVISRIFEPLQVKEQGFNSALSVLRLSKKFGVSRLENACQLAIATVYSPRYRDLNAILVSNQDVEDFKRRQQKALNTDGLLRGSDYYKKLEEART